MTWNTEYVRQYRAKRKASGLCVSCGKPARAQRTDCQVCADKQREYKRTRTTAALAKGLCAKCKASPARDDRQTCAPCGRAAVIANGKRARLRIQRGLCVHGSCPSPARPNQSLCATHLQRMREHNAAMYRARLDAGLCRQCGKHPRLYGDSAHCLECRIAHRRKFTLPKKIRRIIHQFWRLDRIDTRRAFAESVLGWLPNERMQRIISLRQGLTDGIDHTLEEVGDTLGLTRERIRQIESRAYQLLTARGYDITALKSPSEIQRASFRSRKRKIDPRKARKERAGQLLREAVKDGRVVRQPCQRCGRIDALAHHHDYSKPLDVIWLCPQHHAEAHGKRVIEKRPRGAHEPKPKRKEYLVPCWLSDLKPSDEHYDAPSIVATLSEFWVKRVQIQDLTGLSPNKINRIVRGLPVDDTSLMRLLRYIEALKQQRAA